MEDPGQARMTKSMFKNRLLKLRHLLEETKLDGIFISAPVSLTYLTGFSGFGNEDRNAFLLITKNQQYIFTHGIYKEAAQTHISHFTCVDITKEEPVSFSLKKLIKQNHIKKLGFEAGDLTVLEFNELIKQIPDHILIPADHITEMIRVKKDEKEIKAIQKACAMGDKAFSYMLSQIKIGITEKELAGAYELFIRKLGSRISFDTIVAFGSNGSLPHHIPTNKKLTKSSFIVLDFGVKIDDYCSDMTRTVFFGTANPKQKKMYETVLTAQQKAIEQLNNKAMKQSGSISINASDIDRVARNYIISQGYPNMPHSLGHGIGLMVHEQPRLSPNSADILTKDMVFSIEPGIYLPDIGGVRIEDLLTITGSGITLLTKSPKHLIELS